MRIGVVACGYADGYPRHAPSGTPILVGGARTRTVGRVSMDMLTVDITAVPSAHVGSPVALWGDGIPVDEVAIAAGTVGYELLCAVAPRVPMHEDDARLMAKAKTVYTCTECGGQAPKWQGQCPHCDAWNTLVETVVEADQGGAGTHRFAALRGRGRGGGARARSRRAISRACRRSSTSSTACWAAGLVEGGVVLIGGDPGIGKSTLLLQAAARLAEQVPGALRDRRGIGAAGGAPREAPRGERLQGAPAHGDRAGEDPGHARRDASARRRDRFDPDALFRARSPRRRARWRRCASARRSSRAWPSRPAPRSCSWATSPRRARSPARACWSTWWTRCSTSRARPTPASA